MALTITDRNSPSVPFERKLVYVTIDFDASYPTGGEALTASDVGLDRIDAVFVESGEYNFEYDPTNEKILAYWGDNNNASDGPLVEVADTTDLSAVSVNALVLGV